MAGMGRSKRVDLKREELVPGPSFVWTVLFMTFPGNAPT